MEMMIEDVVEITCVIKIKDGEARVFGCRFDQKTKRWFETDLTEFLPIDEALRIQALASEHKSRELRRVIERAV